MGIIKFTREGTVVLLLAMAVGMGAINTGNSLLYLVLALMISLLITSAIFSEITLYKIKVERRLPTHIFADKPFSVEFLLSNRKRVFSSFALTVVDDLGSNIPGARLNFFRIPSGSTSAQIYSHCFPRRGLYRLYGYKISTSFPFGFFAKSKKKPLPAEIIVYPKIQDLNLPPLYPPLRKGGIKGGYFSQIEGAVFKQKGRGTEIYNLRDYISGDDSRLIHWKASAHLSRLLVKEFEGEEQKKVCLVMDHSLPRGFSEDQREALEEGISLIASLAYHYIRQGFQVQLLTHTDVIPLGGGTHHLYQILRCLALLSPWIKEDGFSGSRLLTELSRGDSLLILLFSMDEKALHLNVRSPLSVVRRHLGFRNSDLEFRILI